MRFVGCVTFEPRAEDLERAVANVASLGGGAVFDNSTSEQAREQVRAACGAAGVSYLGDGRNVGTGSALNALVEAAGAADWLLYLDQDSRCGEGFAASLDAQVADDVAAVGAQVLHAGDPVADSPRWVPVAYVLASGTAYRVAAVRELGGFDEAMFLDTVDHEYCLNARRHGWRLLQDNDRVLQHEIGSDSRLVSRSRGLRVARHPVWRRRLMWRNSTVLVRRYGRVFPRELLRHLLVRVVETVLGAVAYRDVRYLTSAVSGVLAGVRDRPVLPPSAGA